MQNKKHLLGLYEQNASDQIIIIQINRAKRKLTKYFTGWQAEAVAKKSRHAGRCVSTSGTSTSFTSPGPCWREQPDGITHGGDTGTRVLWLPHGRKKKTQAPGLVTELTTRLTSRLFWRVFTVPVQRWVRWESQIGMPRLSYVGRIHTRTKITELNGGRIVTWIICRSWKIAPFLHLDIPSIKTTNTDEA